MILIIILSVMVWYGIGLIGSAIAMGSLAKYLDDSFPMLPHYNTKQDKGYCYLMAILGVNNLLGALVFSLISTHNISMRWDWVK